MKNLLSTVLLDAHSLPAGGVQAVTQACQQSLFTGLLRLEAGDVPFIMTFLKGAAEARHHYKDGNWKPMPEPDWETSFQAREARLGRLAATVEGLRLCRLFLETRAALVEEARLDLPEITSRLQARLLLPEPGLLHLKDEAAEHLIAVPAAGLPFVEGLSISAAGAQFFVAGADDLPLQPARRYAAAFYAGSLRQDTWREYNLRLAFSPLMRILILRFGDLAGRLLAERLGARLTEVNQEHGWEIVINGGGISRHQQLFNNLEEASRAYGIIAGRFLDETSQVVGERLAKGMRDMALNKLGRPQRELLQAHILELRTPELDRQAA